MAVSQRQGGTGKATRLYVHTHIHTYEHLCSIHMYVCTYFFSCDRKAVIAAQSNAPYKAKRQKHLNGELQMVLRTVSVQQQIVRRKKQ